MSVFGLGRKQDFQPLFAWEWNTVIDAIDTLYMSTYLANLAMSQGLATLNIYALTTQDGVVVYGMLTAAKGATFGNEIYVSGYKVLHDMDPIYIAAFISSAAQTIQQIINNQTSIISTLQQYLGATNYYLQNILTAVSGVRAYTTIATAKSLALSVSTTPAPISATPLKARYAVIFVPTDSPYPVYIGDANTQYLPLAPGTQFPLYWIDLSTVYVSSIGATNAVVFAETVTG